MTLDDLLAREGIRDLVARYNSYGDSGRFDPLWGLFVQHATMDVSDAGGRVTHYEGLDQIKSIFTGAQDRVKTQLATSGPTYIRHFTATHQIDLVDSHRATGRCYFSVIIDEGLDHWGRYIDRYVSDEGTWKFEQRKVFIDGRSPTSWFAGDV